MLARLKNLKFSASSAPLALVITCLLVFGLLIGAIGLYWDDWAKLLVERLFGLSGYPAYYAEDRPLSAWTHMLFTPLLGVKPLHWHIFILVLIAACAVSLYWTLTRLWPGRTWQATAAALIFIVHPVFTAQSAAVTFHQQYLQYLFILLSFGCMLAAVRARAAHTRRFIWLTILSVVLSLLQLSVTEYFAPLELLRPFMLLFLSAELSHGNFGRRLRWSLGHYLPYLLIIVVFCVWRLFFIQISGDDPYRAVILDQLTSQPLEALRWLAPVMLQDGLHMLVAVWSRLFTTDIVTGLKPFHMATLAFSAGLFVALLFYLNRLESPTDEAPAHQRAWQAQAAVLGMLGVFLGALPAWITARQVLFDIHSDRYALPAILGLSLLIVVAVEWLTPRRLQKAAVIALLVAVASGYQLRVSNDYRWNWTEQKRFYWQLQWRAPGLKPGTAVVVEQDLFPENALFSTSSALNLLYPQGNTGDEFLDYWMYALAPRYNVNNLPENLAFTFQTQFRTLKFKGGVPATLLLSYDLNRASCLWVLTEDDASDPFLSPLLKETLPISNLARILTDPADEQLPPRNLFGDEPEHTWCWFFQKADLARQNQDWDSVVELGDQALALGYSPSDERSNSVHEWLPFIEGYSRSGRINSALELNQQVFENNDPRYAAQLCSMWARIAPDLSPDALPGVGEAENLLGCQS